MSSLSFPLRPSGGVPSGCSGGRAAQDPGRLAVPEVVVVVVVVVVLAGLAVAGRSVPEALMVLVVALADLIRRRPGPGRRGR